MKSVICEKQRKGGRTSCFACSHGRAVHTCERKTMYVIIQVYMRINILLARGRGHMECDDDNIIAPSSTLLSSSYITSHSFLSRFWPLKGGKFADWINILLSNIVSRIMKFEVECVHYLLST